METIYDMSIWNLVWAVPSILIVLGWISSVFYLVRGKEMAVLETLGKPHNMAVGSGIHFKAPWPITSVKKIMSTQLQQIEAKVEIKTKDNVFMVMPIKAQYRVDEEPAQAVKAFYELSDPEEQMTAYILNIVRQVAAKMDMTQLYENRADIEKTVSDELTERFYGFGYVVENVLVDQPIPPASVAESFNRVIASQRAREAAANEAEAIRVKLVGQAQAESESKKLQGEGMASMRKAIADGLKDSLDTIKEAGLTTEQALDMLNKTNQLDTMGQVARRVTS